MGEKGMHDNHRDRMRERILCSGINGLAPHEVLEYLLYAFVPRKDTNPLAHKLIDEFGSLPAVFNADPQHLAEVAGMTKNASLFLSVLPEIARKYVSMSMAQEKPELSSPAKTLEFLSKLFLGLEVERVYSVALDKSSRVIATKEWTSNNRAFVALEPKDIVGFAQSSKAVSVLIAHNHPNGNVHPSGDDVTLTRQIMYALNVMGFKLDDHIIFDDKGRSYSFAQQHFFDKWKTDIDKFKGGI